MIRRVIAFLAILSIFANTAHALTIRASEPDSQIIQKDLEKLPTCLVEKIDTKLKSISVVKHFPDENFDGQRYHVLADSFPFQGTTYIDAGHVKRPGIVMHEMGHWFYWTVMLHDYSKAWTRAVELDGQDMSPSEKYDNDYLLQDPEEALAELFAYHILGEGYWKHPYYDVDKFPRSNAMLTQIIKTVCPQMLEIPNA